MKIFYQYSDAKKLTPITGDCINEINFIRTLREFADVTYGCQGEYDLYFVRGNVDLFLELPHPKIWVAAPFNRDCYEQADLIATFSEPWAEGIRNGNNFTWIPQKDKISFYNAVNISQAIGDDFIPLRKHLLTKRIRKQINSNFVIGHFGRIVKGSYPAAFLRILPELKKMGVRFLCASTGSQKNFVVGNGVKYDKLIKKHGVAVKEWNKFDNFIRREFTYQQMPYAISACDLICVYGQAWSGDWEICGSRSVLEAAACGVPIICGDSAARRDLMGEDYPLFHSGFNKNGDNIVSSWYFNSKSNKNDANELLGLIKKVINGGNLLRTKIGSNLANRTNEFKPKKLSKRIEPIFNKLIK